MNQFGWVRGGALVALLAGSGVAAAGEYPYLGGGLSLTSFEDTGRASVDNMPAVQIVGGSNFSRYFGIESRIQFGVSDVDGDMEAAATFASVDYAGGISYALYLRPQLPLGTRTRLFGLFGGGVTEIEVHGDGAAVGKLNSAGHDDVLSYGAGVEVDIARQFSVMLDYVAFDDFDDAPTLRAADLATVSLNLIYSFE